MSQGVDLLLLLACHVFEAFDYPEAIRLAAETGKGEADIPLSCNIIEAQERSLRYLFHCYHAGIILLDPYIVVEAFVIEKLSC